MENSPLDEFLVDMSVLLDRTANDEGHTVIVNLL